MPATGYALLLLLASGALGLAARGRRSRMLGVAAALAFGACLLYVGLLLLGVERMG